MRHYCYISDMPKPVSIESQVSICCKTAQLISHECGNRAETCGTLLDLPPPTEHVGQTNYLLYRT